MTYAPALTLSIYLGERFPCSHFWNLQAIRVLLGFSCAWHEQYMLVRHAGFVALVVADKPAI